MERISQILFGVSASVSKILAIKTVLYQMYAIIGTILVVGVITGNVRTAFGVAMAEIAIKTILYFSFEVSWTKFQRKIV